MVVDSGIPEHLLPDNGTSSFNTRVQRLVNSFEVDHVQVSLYYHYGNGEAEATKDTASCSKQNGLRET